MSTTRKALRQSLAELVPGAHIGTASSESNTTDVFDTDEDHVTYGGEGGHDLTGYWVVRADSAVAGDRLRRVSHHDLGLGRLTVSRVYTNGPSGETYELWPPDMRPTLVDAAISDGLERLTYRVEDTITPVARDNSYALSALTWITTQRDVREVWYEYTNSNIVERQPWPWWKVYDDSGTFTLHLDPAPYATTGINILVEGIGHYGTLATDAATTTAPANWAVAAAQVELYRRIIKEVKGQTGAGWGADYMDARRNLRRLSMRYAPRVKRRMQWGSATRMPSIGTVRRGEFLY